MYFPSYHIPNHRYIFITISASLLICFTAYIFPSVTEKIKQNHTRRGNGGTTSISHFPPNFFLIIYFIYKFYKFYDFFFFLRFFTLTTSVSKVNWSAQELGSIDNYINSQSSMLP